MKKERVEVNNEYLMHFGQFLRRYREQRDVTMMDIVSTGLISESGVSLNERRYGHVNLPVVEAYSQYFNISVWKLFKMASEEKDEEES